VDPSTNPGTDSGSDPDEDTRADLGMRHDGKPVPPAIAEALLMLRVLIAYGRHLASILPVSATWRAYATIARFLPMASLAETHARICRGILRAMALEKVLLARARLGRDLQYLRRPQRRDQSPVTHYTADLIAGLTTEQAEPPSEPQRRRYRPDDRWGIWPNRLITLAEMEQHVGGRPIGSTIADICLDLGISYKLCAPWLWKGLMHAIVDYRGNLQRVCAVLYERENRFLRDYCGHHEPPEMTREGVARVVRFFIGERPVDPCPPPSPIYPIVSTGRGPPRLLGWA
jgi:hypothetical protein